jgi:hypothetical protein
LHAPVANQTLRNRPISTTFFVQDYLCVKSVMWSTPLYQVSSFKL